MIGICSWAFSGILRGNRSIADLSREAHAAGFDALEAAYSLRHPLDGSREEFASMPARVTSLGTLELHRFHLTDPCAERRERALQVVRGMIACAEGCGIPSISFSPGRLWPGEDLERSLDALTGMLAPLIDTAEVEICLENLPGHILERRDAMRGILAGLPRVRVCLDVGNAVLDPPAGAWFAAFGPRIGKLHISDGRYADGRFSMLLPGEGDVEWEDVRRGLAELDGAVDLFIEALPPEQADEDVFLRRCRNSAEQVLLPGMVTV